MAPKILSLMLVSFTAFAGPAQLLIPETPVFVDSAGGSDVNPGTIGSPCKTLAGMLAAKPYSRQYRLKRGSVFREQFYVPDNGAASDYGSGSKPVISGADVLLNANFSLAGGQTKTYQYSITPSTTTNQWASVSSSIVLMVWEDNVRLLGGITTYSGSHNNYTSVSDVEGTAGTWWYDSVNHLLYIHPTLDGNPVTNGKSYEGSVRTLAINGGRNTWCDSIVGEKAYALTSGGQQGYGILGLQNNRYYRCIGRMGWNHAFGVANNENGFFDCDSCLASDCVTDLSFASTLFVAFKGGSSHGTAYFTNCFASYPTMQDVNHAMGYYAHDDVGAIDCKMKLLVSGSGAANCYYPFNPDVNNGMQYVSGTWWSGLSNYNSMWVHQTNFVSRIKDIGRSVGGFAVQSDCPGILFADSVFHSLGINANNTPSIVVSNCIFVGAYDGIDVYNGSSCQSYSNVFSGLRYAYNDSGLNKVTDADWNVYNACTRIGSSIPANYPDWFDWTNGFPAFDIHGGTTLPGDFAARTNFTIVTDPTGP